MTNLLDDASLPSDPSTLQEQIAAIEQSQLACVQEIKRLMQEEQTAGGVCHAAAIHEAKQKKMLLQYQKDVRAARLKKALFTDNGRS